MSENASKAARGRRRAKRLLSPSQKYEIWLQLLRQESTVAEVAAERNLTANTTGMLCWWSWSMAYCRLVSGRPRGPRSRLRLALRSGESTCSRAVDGRCCR